jgi:hypothetical protein
VTRACVAADACVGAGGDVTVVDDVETLRGAEHSHDDGVCAV